MRQLCRVWKTRHSMWSEQSKFYRMSFLVNRYDSIDIIKMRNQIRINRIRIQIFESVKFEFEFPESEWAESASAKSEWAKSKSAESKWAESESAESEWAESESTKSKWTKSKCLYLFHFREYRRTICDSFEWRRKIDWIRQWRTYADLINIVSWSRMTILLYRQISTLVEDLFIERRQSRDDENANVENVDRELLNVDREMLIKIWRVF